MANAEERLTPGCSLTLGHSPFMNLPRTFRCQGAMWLSAHLGWQGRPERGPECPSFIALFDITLPLRRPRRHLQIKNLCLSWNMQVGSIEKHEESWKNAQQTMAFVPLCKSRRADCQPLALHRWPGPCLSALPLRSSVGSAPASRARKLCDSAPGRSALVRQRVMVPTHDDWLMLTV